MKVLAFQGSPRMEKGITDRLLKPFLAGAAEAGAEIEVVYVARQKIKYCTGCFGCWLVHPGECAQKDDMKEILQKLRRADILVYASPIYVDGFTAQMKTLMDRMITAAQPFVEFRDGHHRHPGRGKGTRKQKTVLISTCGFGELDNFDPIIHHMTAASKNMRAEFLGALVRPMGPILEFLEGAAPDTTKSIYEGFRRGGYEAVAEGRISEEAKKAASAPIMSMEHFVTMANKFFQMEIDKNAAKHKAREAVG